MNDSDIGTVFIEDIAEGDSRQLSKVIGDAEIRAYAELSEDRNPLHLDDDHAAGSMFGGRIAHGMLSAGLFSALIGERLPGHGTVYLSQSLRFTAPVRPGDRVDASVTVTSVNRARGRVGLECEARVGDRVVIRGEALVLAPRRG